MFFIELRFTNRHNGWFLRSISWKTDDLLLNEAADVDLRLSALDLSWISESKQTGIRLSL